MDKEIIEKSFDDIIGKHSDFLYNIEGTLREITDTKEEYKTLKEDIWRFWKETKNLDHEQLIMKGENGTFFENRNGDKDSVGKTEEMKEFVTQATVYDGERVLYTMHNHPSGCCMPSLPDTSNFVIVNEKYKVVLSKNGLCIFKNNNGSETFLDYEDVISSYNMMDKKISTDFTKEYYDEYTELEKKYPKWYDDETQDYVNYHNEFDKFYSESINKHLNEYITLFNKKLHTKNRNVKVNAYYVPRTPRVY